jgi:hypothetical protein
MRLTIELDCLYLRPRGPLHAAKLAKHSGAFSSECAPDVATSNSQTPILAQRRTSYIESNITRPRHGLTPVRRGAS